jgi:hypothetical protein
VKAAARKAARDLGWTLFPVPRFRPKSLRLIPLSACSSQQASEVFRIARQLL